MAGSEQTLSEVEKPPVITADDITDQEEKKMVGDLTDKLLNSWISDVTAEIGNKVNVSENGDLPSAGLKSEFLVSHHAAASCHDNMNEAGCHGNEVISSENSCHGADASCHDNEKSYEFLAYDVSDNDVIAANAAGKTETISDTGDLTAAATPNPSDLVTPSNLACIHSNDGEAGAAGSGSESDSFDYDYYMADQDMGGSGDESERAALIPPNEGATEQPNDGAAEQPNDGATKQANESATEQPNGSATELPKANATEQPKESATEESKSATEQPNESATEQSKESSAKPPKSDFELELDELLRKAETTLTRLEEKEKADRESLKVIKEASASQTKPEVPKVPEVILPTLKNSADFDLYNLRLNTGARSVTHYNQLLKIQTEMSGMQAHISSLQSGLRLLHKSVEEMIKQAEADIEGGQD